MTDLHNQDKNTQTKMDEKELQDMVAASDTGARIPHGWQGKLLLGTALIWSLFQLWIASPLPFYDWPIFGSFGIFNGTEVRAIHLGFAMFYHLRPIRPWRILLITAYPSTI